MTEHEVMERLREAIKAAGNQRQFALRHDFTPGYITDVLHGRRALADRILETIGVKREVVYREQEKQP